MQLISNSTLIIGVDIAKRKHVARACDFRGIELGKKIDFKNDINGFNKLKRWVEELQKTENKYDVIIGMEPTGHYWFNLYDHIEEYWENSLAVLVETYVSKYTRKLYGNVSNKTDPIDARAISLSVKDGRFFKRLYRDEIYSDLNNLMRLEEKQVEMRSRAKNNIIRMLDIYFPEYSEVFKNPACKTSIAILKNFPMPNQIRSLSDEQILKTLKPMVGSSLGIKKIKVLKAAAELSIGRRKCTETAVFELLSWIELYEKYEDTTRAIMLKVEQLIKSIKWADHLLKIKGMALKSVATIAAEAGDISKYKCGKQLITMCGLNLRENSSGNHKGETTITKRGNKRLRKILYMTVLPVMNNNPEFKQLHEYYTTRNENPLKKKQSIIALECKLLRIIHGMAVNNTEYNPLEVFKSIKINELKLTA
jgi:transposase